MSGFVLCYRKIWESQLFEGSAERVGMFVWLLHKAAWKETKFDVKGETITLQRGQACITERQMAAECGVGRQVVRTFLRHLFSTQTVTQHPTQGLTQPRTVITICNYENYQAAPEKANPALTQHPTTRQPIKEQENTSVAKATDAESVADIRTRIYAMGKAALAKGGTKNPGALITKWLAKASEADVLAAIIASDGRNDRVAFIEGALRRRAKPDRRSMSHEEDLQQRGIRDAEELQRAAGRRGHNRSPAARNAADDVPRMFAPSAEENGPVPFGDVRDGPDSVPLLALPAQWSAVA